MRLSGRKQWSPPRRRAAPRQLGWLILIALNVAAFVAQFLVDSYHTGFCSEYLGLSQRGVDEAYAWQFATALFLQTSVWHLLANVAVLYWVGRDVQTIVGERHFLAIYCAGAFGGELLHLFAMPTDSVLFAATGGVAAIFVAYAAILPELELTASLLFVLPLRVKAKHLALLGLVGAAALLVVDRTGVVGHSAYVGGALAGWIYAHLLGFGRPSFVQRFLQQRQAQLERLRTMPAREFIRVEVDPLLEKIARSGIASLTRAERRILETARAKMLGE